MPILAFPDYNIPLYLGIDTSEKGIANLDMYFDDNHIFDDNDVESRRVIRYGRNHLTDGKGRMDQ